MKEALNRTEDNQGTGQCLNKCEKSGRNYFDC